MLAIDASHLMCYHYKQVRTHLFKLQLSILLFAVNVFYLIYKRGLYSNRIYKCNINFSIQFWFFYQNVKSKLRIPGCSNVNTVRFPYKQCKFSNHLECWGRFIQITKCEWVQCEWASTYELLGDVRHNVWFMVHFWTRIWAKFIFVFSTIFIFSLSSCY